MTQENLNIFFSSLPDFETEAAEEKRLARLPKEPSFSLSDMEQARTDAQKKGYNDGLEAAKLTIEQRTELLVQSIVDDVSLFKGHDEERYDLFINQSIDVSFKTVKALVSPILNQEKETLIEASLRSFFEDHSTRATLTIYVHPDMKTPVEKYITMINPDLILKTDDTLDTTNCYIKWDDGEFRFEPDKMLQSILDIMQSYNNNADDVEPLDEASKKQHTDEKPMTNEDLEHE